MNHLGGPSHAGGQNRCKAAFADSTQVPVFHHLMSLGASRSIPDCFLKSLWGDAVPALHTYLHELLNSKVFWRVQVKTTVVLCDRSGNPLEAEEKSILNNSCRMPAMCTGKQAQLLSEADGQNSALLETCPAKRKTGEEYVPLLFPTCSM